MFINLSMSYRDDLAKFLKIYAITDREYIAKNNYTFQKAVEEAIIGGVTIIQIREKKLAFDEFLKEAINIKRITMKYNVPLIINDNIEIALKSDADGVHLGQEDLKSYGGNFKKIRDQLKDKIIGISANSVEEALMAEQNGADYLGVNTPFVKTKFSNNTKLDAKQVSFSAMKDIINSVKIPCVAIGGIHKNTIPLLKGYGICGIAMISEVFNNRDIQRYVSDLKSFIHQIAVT